MKKYFKYIVCTFLVILLIYNLTVIIKSVINPNKTPSFLGIKTYIIVSGSMEPNLNIGDVVIVRETDDIKVGDIISFRDNMEIITHRVSDIQVLDGETKYQTKGDNNNNVDTEFVNLESIEGKVINKIPKIGNILLFLQRKEIIILAIVTYYIYMFRRSKGVRKDEEV